MELREKRHRSVYWSFGLGGALVVIGLAALRLDHHITTTARLGRDTDVLLYAPADARLAAWQAGEGAAVTTGQALATLENGEIGLRVAELRREWALLDAERKRAFAARAEAELGPAGAEYVLAADRAQSLATVVERQEEIERTLQRGRDLNVVSQLELGRQQIAVLEARAARAAAERLLAAGQERAGRAAAPWAATLDGLEKAAAALREALATAEAAAEALVLRAPTNGVLAVRYRRRPGGAVTRGEALARITDPSAPYQARAVVGQKNVDLIRTGQPVRMESAVFGAAFGSYLRGRVAWIVPHHRAADSDPRTEPQYEVWMSIDDAPYPLVDDSQVTAHIVLGRRSLGELFLSSMGFRRDPRRGEQRP